MRFRPWTRLGVTLFLCSGARADDCDYAVEWVRGGQQCLHSVPCETGQQTSVLYVKGLPVPVSSGAVVTACCEEKELWPAHTRKIVGDHRVWVDHYVRGWLVLRECSGKKGALIFTWGVDRCRYVDAIQHGSYPIHDWEVCGDGG